MLTSVQIREDLAKSIDNLPGGMTIVKWRSLMVEWKKEEWQKKSSIASKNCEQSTWIVHIGDSASMTIHTRHLVSIFFYQCKFYNTYDFVYFCQCKFIN